MTDDIALVEALPEVIAAWQKTRHPRLGDVAELLDERLAKEAPRAPLRAGKKQADLDAWRVREAAKDPRDFAVLLAAARGGGQTDVIAHVQALAAWEDPRLGAGLLRLLEKPPYAGVKSRGMLEVILAALEGTRDPRLATRARELGRRYLGIVNSSTGGWVAERLEALAERAARLPVAVLSPDIEALCAALEARLGDALGDRRRAESDRRTGEQLLAGLFDAVYASPDDDGPRLVLADALQQLGDERGELIVLQVTRARGAQTPEQARREQQLATEDRLAAWAQPLSHAGMCQFERGFPVHVHLYSRSLKKALGRPEWATVQVLEGLRKQSVKQAVELLMAPALAGVRDPGEMDAALLLALAARGRRQPWTTLNVQDAHLLAPSTLASVPELRRLKLTASATLAADLLRALEHLEELEVWLRDVLPPAALFDGLRLRELTLGLAGVNLTPEALPLPPTLEVLHLFLNGRAVPRGLFADLPRLRELSIGASLLDGLGSELGLPALRSLSLTCSSKIAGPRHLFEGVPGLTRLHLTLSGPPLAAELFRPLGALKELSLHVDSVATGALASLTALESLQVWKLPADALPPEMPLLRDLQLPAPKAPEELARFLARCPRLERLWLTIPYGLDVTALLPVLDAAAVPWVALDERLLLQRDERGPLSRMHVRGYDRGLAQQVGTSLSGRLQVTCDPNYPGGARVQLEEALGFPCEVRAGVSLRWRDDSR